MGLLSLACSGGAPAAPERAAPAARPAAGGTGVPAALELPGCLRDLLAQCAPEGPCISTTAPVGFGHLLLRFAL